MVDIIATLTTFADDAATNTVLSWLSQTLNGHDAVAYYKHPVIMTTTGVAPDLMILTRRYQPITLRCISSQLSELQTVTSDTWTIDSQTQDSPILELEDLVVALKARFDKDRAVRGRLVPRAVLALPLISKSAFEQRFTPLDEITALWAGGDVSEAFLPIEPELNDLEWTHARSILQGVAPLRTSSAPTSERADTLGQAAKLLDRQIALLDDEQARAALQIAPGPQRIRGLAGTGKTILLAMKAANLHLHFPTKKILFTFNTQSLYNQIQSLVTRFYRFAAESDPDWDLLHIRHAWGGKSKPGVYYELCARQGVAPLDLRTARALDSDSPFKACCITALKRPIAPEYDFILIDEAQDFPAAFFQLIYQMSHAPHCIYWAYDDLQSLYAVDIPMPEALFGVDAAGVPNVTLKGEPYPANIEKDLVLHRSYRCPGPVLMLAHAIGLGIYSETGCVQMLKSRASWEALGYVVEQGAEVDGTFRIGSAVVISRPAQNSPNPIQTIYSGTKPLVSAHAFSNRPEEYTFVAQSIADDIRVERIRPEQIVVICLDSRKMTVHLPEMQRCLLEKGVASTIPGLVDDAAAFGEPGHVTLSTVFRAKGNEAFVVYVTSFDALFDYVLAVENRNRAFTALSRSKAWVRITGVGPNMKLATEEIRRVLEDQPRFRFAYPDPAKTHTLEADTDRRRRVVEMAKVSAEDLLDLDKAALRALAASNPKMFRTLLSRLEEAKRLADK